MKNVAPHLNLSLSPKKLAQWRVVLIAPSLSPMLKRSLIVLAALFPFCAFAAADFAPATTATNKLGLELFRQLAATKPGENLLLSP